ncbi:MAG: exodeoxyribonuclease VII large subunit, partial [Candidatus Latescibacteria bacterium]|nr:exodeoxyribonuclease VII large subunit [Candidatus Latescibacterota bacterium]
MLDSAEAYSVSDITRAIKGLLDEGLMPLWVEGEVSNYVHHTSGHRYFTLKDETSQLRCVMWKWQGQLRFRPEDGMKVRAYGRISVYERGGQYQLVVSELHPAGVGELQLAFEQLKERLAKEGLFDESRKRSLPRFPQRIGVVTSPTGAAIRDIAHGIGRRFPSAQVVLWPARVQGEGAAAQIAEGIEKLNAYGEVDVLIVGRGGGSLEDLWAFNEEEVARAIYASGIPVVSAVGHEIDFVIADFVADRRAPTPSAAAEMVVRDGAELMRGVTDLRGRAER